MSHDITHYKQSGSRQRWGERQFADTRKKSLLVRRGRARNDSAGRIACQTRRFQFARDVRVIVTGHVDHESGAASGQLVPVGSLSCSKLDAL